MEVAVEGVKLVGVEAISVNANDPDLLLAVDPDGTVPGRFVTGVEASEDSEPEFAPNERESVPNGKSTVSPGLHGRGDGERTRNREDIRKDDGVNSARESATRNDVFDDDVSEVRKKSGVLSVQSRSQAPNQPTLTLQPYRNVRPCPQVGAPTRLLPTPHTSPVNHEQDPKKLRKNLSRPPQKNPTPKSRRTKTSNGHTQKRKQPARPYQIKLTMYYTPRRTPLDRSTLPR